MKKSLLAVAVLGAFSAMASAQSSVTIYGVLDLALTKGNGGTAFNNGANGTSKAWTLKQSAASRLGFRGNEDLGGGLSAQFQIEHRFTPDTGAANAIFWHGRSYVQLTSKDLGSVYLGREYAPTFVFSGKMDPFGTDGVAQMGGRLHAGYSVNPIGTNNATAESPSWRQQNAIGYRSPNLGGLTVMAAVGLAEGVTQNRDVQFNVEYGAGPIYAGMGYARQTGALKFTGGPAPTTFQSNNGDGSSLINVGGAYDLGVIRPMVYFARAKSGANVLGQSTWNKFYMIGATAPIGGGKLKVAYGRLEPRGANNTENKFGLGYDYPLSKRTNLYADLALAKQDTKSNNNAYAFGLKHTF